MDVPIFFVVAVDVEAMYGGVGIGTSRVLEMGEAKRDVCGSLIGHLSLQGLAY